jgi:S-(hydroxymethyl)glutathione dehydrogenase/alcohol dehydrogenase
MRAAVLYARREPFAVEEVRLVEPGPGEVEVQVVASGVCHSDHHQWVRAAGVPLPAVLGHEGAGVVASVGPGVSRVRPGDHVILVFGVRCGRCSYCRRGEGNLCRPEPPRARLFAGDQPLLQFTGLGTFGERAVVSELNCVPIRPDAPLAEAALIGCGVTTGVGAAVNTARVEPGANVAVIGTGGVGLNVVQGARLAGAARVIAVDVRANKLELAREFGATHVVDASREDPVGAVQRLTGGDGADYAFEVIGGAATIRQAIDMVRRGGTAVVVGVAPDDETIALPAALLTRNGKRLVGSWYGSSNPDVDFPRLVDLVMEGRLKLRELVTRRFALEEINEAFRALEAGEVARGLVEYQR